MLPGAPAASAFVVVGHVHVLDTNGTAIGLLQGFQDIAQLGVVRQALQGTDTEGLVQVGIGETVERRLQLVDLGRGRRLSGSRSAQRVPSER
jgi:hypothetical protein